MTTLPQWWGVLNDRRQALIRIKYTKGLRKNELREFSVLQAVADLVITAYSAPAQKFAPALEKLEAHAHRLLEKTGRDAWKSKKKKKSH